jgi:hypothetical protein
MYGLRKYKSGEVFTAVVQSPPPLPSSSFDFKLAVVVLHYV